MRNTAFMVMLLWLISVAVPGIAQVDTGTVVGTITESSGAFVAGATVTATEMDPFITDGFWLCRCDHLDSDTAAPDSICPEVGVLASLAEVQMNDEEDMLRCSAETL